MAVTLATVAQRAGVSPATVSRVLNGDYPVAAETRKRVEKAVRELDYVVNAHARALLHSTSGLVGAILNDVSDPFFALVLRGIQVAAGDLGRLVVTAHSDGDPDRELAGIDLLRRQRADAVIVVGSGPEDTEYRRQLAAQARGLRAQDSRLVLCGRPKPARDAPASVVTFDDVATGRALVEHLVGLGHRRIAYLGGPPGRTTSTDRRRGVVEGLERAGLKVDERLLADGDGTREAGHARVGELLDSGLDFTAIIGSNDQLAIGALAALRDVGWSVPEDMSVAGIGDLPGAADLVPSLTTVHLSLEEAGRQAVSLAFAPQGPARTVILPHRLIVRDSTGRARKRTSTRPRRGSS
jgi:LacI family transcriptional regulator